MEDSTALPGFPQPEPIVRRGSPDAKFGRAEQHLSKLEALVDGFVERKPFRLAFQSHRFEHLFPESNVPNYEIVIRDIEPVPDRIGLRLGDFLTNLRASLDHMAWNLVLANDGEPDDHTTFPIKSKEPREPGSGKPVPLRIFGGASDEAMALVKAAQPYERRDGDDPTTHPLWILDRLVGIDKHRHLPIFVVGLQGITSYVGEGEDRIGVDWAKLSPPRRLFNGANVCTMGIDADAKMDVDLDIATTVALGEGEPAGGEPLSEVCRTLRDAARNVLDALSNHAG
jgi:hypothetical protein